MVLAEEKPVATKAEAQSFMVVRNGLTSERHFQPNQDVRQPEQMLTHTLRGCLLGDCHGEKQSQGSTAKFNPSVYVCVGGEGRVGRGGVWTGHKPSIPTPTLTPPEPQGSSLGSSSDQVRFAHTDLEPCSVFKRLHPSLPPLFHRSICGGEERGWDFS